jgi:hypothetical protein
MGIREMALQLNKKKAWRNIYLLRMLMTLTLADANTYIKLRQVYRIIKDIVAEYILQAIT